MESIEVALKTAGTGDNLQTVLHSLCVHARYVCTCTKLREASEQSCRTLSAFFVG